MKILARKTLTHFMPLFFFYTLRNYQKTSDFPMFLGGIQRDYWNGMFSKWSFKTVFKNGTTKICGRQPLRLSSTYFTWSILKYFVKFVSFLTNFTSCYSSPVLLRFTDIVSEKLVKKIKLHFQVVHLLYYLNVDNFYLLSKTWNGL